MILESLTIFHVLLSLAGIVSGFVVAFDLMNSKWSDSWTSLFLTTTVATSVTGFFFPIHGFTPGLGVGILSLVVLGIAIFALRRHRLLGGWRRAYVICSIIALYLNFFVLIVQLFEKVPALRAIAPTHSEPPFQIAQVAALAFFAWVGVRATRKFHGEPHGMAGVSGTPV